ncbi:proto-oncogene tyrosine-protein kinase ros [Lasius niger]|uniref:Proto-oncogene tyrosine-protein kinase ros n=1 Tax=Lasius niger TaxID=67767 RepID=A0A0J7NNL8_LASNI|nr:proto-oncogene tyrosine-protein kinase ros [Lasius niger]
MDSMFGSDVTLRTNRDKLNVPENVTVKALTPTIAALSMDPMFGSDVTLRTNPDKLNISENVTVQALTPTIAADYWMPPKKLNCVTKWLIADNFEAKNEAVMYYIKNLLSGTSYKFRLILTYPEYENYTWPSDGRFTFQTLGKWIW